MRYPRGAFFPSGNKSRTALRSAGRVLIDTRRGLEHGFSAARGGDRPCEALGQTLRISMHRDPRRLDSIDGRRDRVSYLWGV